MTMETIIGKQWANVAIKARCIIPEGSGGKNKRKSDSRMVYFPEMDFLENLNILFFDLNFSLDQINDLG